MAWVPLKTSRSEKAGKSPLAPAGCFPQLLWEALGCRSWKVPGDAPLTGLTAARPSLFPQSSSDNRAARRTEVCTVRTWDRAAWSPSAASQPRGREVGRFASGSPSSG